MPGERLRGPETARPGPQLASDRESPGNRDRNRYAALGRRRRPECVPELRRGRLSGPEDVQAHPLEATRLRSSLAADVQRFVDNLLTGHANRVNRRPKAFKKRVLALVGQRLPPYPRPSGRPQQPWITKAAAMYADQLRDIRQGGRKRVNWNPIANACIPGFPKIRSAYRRRAELDKLRDAVYRRRANAGARLSG